MKYAINDMAHDINEIKSSITNMAQRIQHRFNEMDARIDELEMAQNILTWVNILKDEDLDKCPPRLRFIIVVRQFYQQKNDNWTMADLKLLRRALGEVGIDFKEEVSIGTLVSELINELDGNSSSIKKYNSLIYVDDSLTAGMVREEISIPSFISLTTLPDSIKKMASASEILSSHLGIDVNEASAKLVISNLEKHHGVCSEQTYDVFGLACQILMGWRLSIGLSDKKSHLQQLAGIISERNPFELLIKDLQNGLKALERKKITLKNEIKSSMCFIKEQGEIIKKHELAIESIKSLSQ